MNDELNSDRLRLSFIVHSSCFIVMLCAAVVLARPDDQLLPGQRRMQRGFHDRVGWHLVNGRWVQASGQCEWSDLIRLSWDGQQLAVDAKPTNRAVGLLRGGRTAAVEVGAAKDLYQIAAPDIPRGGQIPLVRNPIQLRPGEQALYITATEMPEPDRFESAKSLRLKSLIAAPNMLRATAEWDVDGKPVEITFMSQPPRGVHLRIAEVGAAAESPLNFVESAATLDDLHRENRAEVRTYLSPLLHRLMGRDAPDLFAPGAADVYAVFSQIEATPDAIRAAEKILPRMIDPDYDTRMAALSDLRKLGPDGVCAIARMRRDELAPQQAVFIEQVLRENSRYPDLSSDDAARSLLRDDPQFLIDCIEFADARVRSAAVQRLSQTLQRNIAIDASDLRACARLANDLRGELNR